jgi:hypothetical protein
VANRAVLLADGVIAADGLPEDVMTDVAAMEKAKLAVENLPSTNLSPRERNT